MSTAPSPAEESHYLSQHCLTHHSASLEEERHNKFNQINLLANMFSSFHFIYKVLEKKYYIVTHPCSYAEILEIN